METSVKVDLDQYERLRERAKKRPDGRRGDTRGARRVHRFVPRQRTAS
jgi:hypothetical protein